MQTKKGKNKHFHKLPDVPNDRDSLITQPFNNFSVSAIRQIFCFNFGTFLGDNFSD